MKTKRLRVNERIISSKVRLISNSGKQIGIIDLSDALRQAKEKSLDLVEISPNANPPVCKILDWGKYKFEIMKREQKQKQRQKTGEMKSIRLSAKIGDHDLETKIKQGVKFINKGNRIKAFLLLKGREITHKEVGERVIKKFQEELLEISEIEKELNFQGRECSIILKPKK